MTNDNSNNYLEYNFNCIVNNEQQEQMLNNNLIYDHQQVQDLQFINYFNLINKPTIPQSPDINLFQYDDNYCTSPSSSLSNNSNNQFNLQSFSSPSQSPSYQHASDNMSGFMPMNQLIPTESATVPMPNKKRRKSNATNDPILIKKPKIEEDTDNSEKLTNSELRRQIHIQSEQKRRAQIKDGFEELRNELPSHFNKKMSKVALLHRTVQHIQHLKNTQITILAELERLVNENEQLKKVIHKQALEKMYAPSNNNSNL